MKNLLIIFVILLTLMGCRTVETIKYIDRVSFVDRYKIDSTYIYKQDSVYILKRNDTVYVEKYKTLLKNKFVIIKDTIYNRDSVYFDKVTTKQIMVEKKLSMFQKFFFGLGKLSFVLVLLFIIYFIVKNYIKIKSYLINLLLFKK